MLHFHEKKNKTHETENTLGNSKQLKLPHENVLASKYCSKQQEVLQLALARSCMLSISQCFNHKLLTSMTGGPKHIPSNLTIPGWRIEKRARTSDRKSSWQLASLIDTIFFTATFTGVVAVDDGLPIPMS